MTEIYFSTTEMGSAKQKCFLLTLVPVQLACAVVFPIIEAEVPFIVLSPMLFMRKQSTKALGKVKKMNVNHVGSLLLPQ